MRRIGWVCGVGLVAGMFVVLGIQRHVVFPRRWLRPAPAFRDDIPGLQQLRRAVPGGHVEAWFIPGRGVTARTPGPLVVFTHGNRELIDDWLAPLMRYRELGISVLLPEYRGYGRSDGVPSQVAIARDVVGFYDEVVARPEVDALRVVFHGRSLGGGVACAVARTRKPSAMILSSTFTSIADVAKRYGIPRVLVLDPFDNLSCVAHLDVPLLIVHGRQDTLIPFQHAERLQQAAAHAQLVAYDAGHNDCPPWDSEFWAVIDHFLRQAQILGVPVPAVP